MAGWIKMPLGMDVGRGPGHIVLYEYPGRSSKFSAHICCGQIGGWIKMPLGKEVGLSPSDIMLDKDPAPLPKRGRSPPIFGPCLLSPNGWMDHDATWYGSRPSPGHIVLDGDPAPPSPRRKRGTAAPMSIVATVAHLSYC